MCSQNNAHEIRIHNVNESEKLLCPLYLLKGSISNPCSCSKVVVTCEKTINYSCSLCPNTGKFKAVVGDLVNGLNHLTISYCSAVVKVTLTHESLVNVKYIVKVLYIVCKNHDGCFQSPSTENSIEDACARLTIGMKLIQSLYCDKLLEHGFGRKTFQLIPGCEPFYSQLTVDEAKQMDERSLWNFFAREVIANEYKTFENRKFIGFIGCTEFQGISDGNYSHENFKSKTVANAALGGGDFALFGTGCLHTWPKSIADVMDCFESNEPIDLRNYLDDSNGRKTFGGCFATTLGSVCHEVGHIFDLGHSHNGIMGSGFDFVNRVFTVTNQTQDLPNRITSKVPPKERKVPNDPRLTNLKLSNKFLDLFHYQKGKDLTYFERNSAITLAYHKWFNQFDNNLPGEIICSENCKKRMIVSRKIPIRLVELRDKNNALMIRSYSFLDECVLEFTIPESIDESCERYVVFVIDDIGNIFKF